MSNDALDVIKEYADKESTGNLVIKRDTEDSDDFAYIYLNNGKIYSALINNEYPPVGARIFSSGTVSPEDFSRVMSEANGDANDPLVYATLLQEELFPERTLHNYIKDEFLSAMRAILSWTDVTHEWRIGETTRAFAVAPISLKSAFDRVRDNLSTVAGIMDEIYILGGEDPESEDLESEIDADNLVPYPISEPNKDEVSTEQFSFYTKLDGKSKLREICDDFGYVITPALRNVYVLWVKGHIGINLYGNRVDPYDKETIQRYQATPESTEDLDETEEPHEDKLDETSVEGEPELDIPEDESTETQAIDIVFDTVENPTDELDDNEVFIDDEDETFDQEPTHAPDEEISTLVEEAIEEEQSDETEEESPEEELPENSEPEVDPELQFDEPEVVDTLDETESTDTLIEVEENPGIEPEVESFDDDDDDEDYIQESLRAMTERISLIDNRIEHAHNQAEDATNAQKDNRVAIEELENRIAELKSHQENLESQAESAAQAVTKLTSKKAGLVRAYEAVLKSLEED